MTNTAREQEDIRELDSYRACNHCFLRSLLDERGIRVRSECLPGGHWSGSVSSAVKTAPRVYTSTPMPAYNQVVRFLSAHPSLREN